MQTTSIRNGIVIAVALAAAVTLGVVNYLHLSQTRHLSTITVVSPENGANIASFYSGLPPVPAYLSEKMDPKEHISACAKKPSLLERAAIKIGLERVAHAQFGCDASSCVGCYVKIVGSECAGACEGGGTIWGNSGGGTICNQGTNLNGPACGVDDGCGCNQTNCTQPPSTCGC